MKNIWLLLCVFSFIVTSARADTLCAKKSAKVNKNGTINLTKNLRATTGACPSGFGQVPGASTILESDNIATSVLNADCAEAATFGGDFVKIGDIGAFIKQTPASLIELTFEGRIRVGSLSVSSSGAGFELRVDDLPSAVGRAMGGIRNVGSGAEASKLIPASITGVFSNLAAGTHTVSMWVNAAGFGASGTGAMYDPGCWGSDHVVVREYRSR